ncbi:hypothetical protein Ancab_005872 [Ancistrocladus abbreviatus]
MEIRGNCWLKELQDDSAGNSDVLASPKLPWTPPQSSATRMWESPFSRATQEFWILAFNIMACLDNLLYVDELTKCSDKLPSVPTVCVVSHKKVPVQRSVPISSTPYKTTLATPSFSPATLLTPAKGEMTTFLSRDKPPHRSLRVRRVLTNYLAEEVRTKSSDGDQTGCGSAMILKPNTGSAASQANTKNMEPQRASTAQPQQKGSRPRSSNTAS